jgi:hypothetical protein
MSTAISDYNWNIIPYIGVGPLLFGMARFEVRNLLGSPVKSFKRGPFTSVETDAFGPLALSVEYDTMDRLRCIEAFATCPIYFRGISLLNKSPQVILNELTSLGLKAREDDGYFFDEGGFVLSIGPEDVVNAVTVYRKGYYEENP